MMISTANELDNILSTNTWILQGNHQHLFEEIILKVVHFNKKEPLEENIFIWILIT